MKLEQIYTGCLSQGAYYIESNGEAAVIDPLREVEPYIERANKNNAKIKYVLETHFHADFVSGHIDLANKTGARIVYGPTAKPNFQAIVAKDREILQVGDVTLTVLHTPGHTLESTCYLLHNEEGKPIGLFTGDTLFIGDVGRPDLAQKITATLTQDLLAGHLYDSLREKIMPLPDDIILYPAHGAGSACGKNMSKETTDTLGNQKKVNYALRTTMTREEFIQEVTTGLMPPPAYFPENVLMNIQGYESIDTVMERADRPLLPNEFEATANETGALLLDTREAGIFTKGFLPNSVNIGIDGSFAPWVGELIPDIKQKILIIAENGREEEVVTRLARVGYDNCIGYLSGGFEQWKIEGREIEQITSLTAPQMKDLQAENPSIALLDVRKASEFFSEHIIGAENISLGDINDQLDKIDKNRKYLVHCAGGYRSMIFISIMKARGYNNLINVAGGFKAIKELGTLPISDYVCPTTML